MNCEIKSIIVDVAKSLDIDFSGLQFSDSEVYAKLVARLTENEMSIEPNFVQALVDQVKRYCLKNLVESDSIDKTVKKYFIYEVDGAKQFDLASYREFMQYASRKLGDALIINVFDDDGEYEVVNSKEKLQDSLTILLSDLNDDFNDDITIYGKNVTDTFKATLTQEDKIKYFQYIMLMHNRELFPKLSGGYVNYNYESDNFEIQDTHHHVAGWQRKDDRSAYEDTSGSLKLLIESTPLYDIYQTKSGKYVARQTKKNLNASMFYEAMSTLLNKIASENWKKYREIIENPRLLVKEIVKYTNSLSTIYSQTDKILYSLRTRYFDDSGISTGKVSIDLVKAYARANSGIIKSNGINHLDAILAGAFKYVKQVYQRYNLDDGSIKNTNVLNIGILATQMAETINYALKKSGLIKYNNTVLGVLDVDKLTDSELLFVLKSISGFDFLQFRGQDLPKDDIKAIIKRAIIDKVINKSDSKLQSLAAYYLNKNPEIIKSVSSRSDGSKVPNYRLGNLANTYHSHLANLQNRIDKSPTGNESPLKKSILYNSPKLYKESRLRLDVYSESGKHKLADEMTEAEQLEAAIGFDYFKLLNTSGEIAIESITPSDKSAIPFQVFNANEKLLGLNKSINEASSEELKNYFKESGANIQKQYLDNSLKLFSLILDIELTGNYVNDINNIDEALKSYSVDQLNQLVAQYNREHGTDYVLSNEFDYKVVKGKGIKFNRLLYGYYLKFTENKFFNDEWNQFINDCKKILKVDNVVRLFAEKYQMTEEDLKKYFYTHAMLSYNYILLTVGSTIAHKYKNTAIYEKPLSELVASDFNNNIAQSYVTSTKRMVALSATGHPYQRGILTGLPNTVNHATISDFISPVADLNASKNAEMNVWDGAVFAPYITLLMSDNSTVDYTVAGMVRKTLGHAMLESKGTATLNKSATFAITNAFLLKNLDGRMKLKRLLEMSLSPATFFHNGQWYDITRNFNGKRINISGYYQVSNNGVLEVYKVSNLKWRGENNYTYTLKNLATNETFENVPVELNSLWDVYQLLGAEFSGEIVTDEFGGDKFVYSESSQYQLLNLINSVGVKINSDVVSQNDVDQFLKKKMIHYFPTESTNKSTQLPIQSNNVARIDPKTGDYYTGELYVVPMDISNTMVQLDADHPVDDAEVSEPTQLISFMAQKGLVQNVTTQIYDSLASLIRNNSKNFVDNAENRRKLVDIFGKGLVKTFLKENVDVMGLAQALMAKVNEVIQANPGVSLDDLNVNIPFSDENLMGKVASDVIIYTNNFIKRKYAGSADIMVPSYDIVMVYEDENGNKYNSMDLIKNPKIWNHLRDIDGTIEVEPNEIEFGNLYYLENEGVYKDLLGNTSTRPIPIEINSYEDFLRIQEDGGRITKCFAKPRNLKGRTSFITVKLKDGSIKKFNIFALNYRYQLEYGKVKDPEDTRLLMNNVLFRAISAKDVNLLNKYGGFLMYDSSAGEWVTAPIVEILDTEYKNPEMSASYKYSSVLNITPGVSINDIKQQGPQYFKDRILINRKVIFPDGMEPSPFVLKSNTGKHLPVYFDTDKIGEFATEENQIEISTDDTGTYRVNKEGDNLYKVEGINFYRVGNVEFAVITNPNKEDVLEDILQSGVFQGYDGVIDPSLSGIFKRNKVFKVNEDFINDLANKQYASFFETVNYITARIPAQSEQFAMPCEIVDLFDSPYNVSLVNKYQTYEQGSKLLEP